VAATENTRIPHRREDIAYHEAAHAVAHVRFDSGASSVTIVPSEAAGSAGSADHIDGYEDFSPVRKEDWSDFQAAGIPGFEAEFETAGKDRSVVTISAKKAEQHVIACLVGYAAQVAHNPSCVTVARLGAWDDFEQARTALRLMGKNTRLDTRKRKAQRFVDQNWKAIELVARDLLELKTLDGGEVECLVGIADGEEDAIETLARYRVLCGKSGTSQFPFRAQVAPQAEI
jgi:hypothetical protein